MSNLIDRDEAINELVRWGKIQDYSEGERNVIACVIGMLDTLPSEQSEIIRCKDCEKREYCRTSTVWAVAPGDDWYCADAERRTDGRD